MESWSNGCHSEPQRSKTPLFQYTNLLILWLIESNNGSTKWRL